METQLEHAVEERERQPPEQQQGRQPAAEFLGMSGFGGRLAFRGGPSSAPSSARTGPSGAAAAIEAAAPRSARATRYSTRQRSGQHDQEPPGRGQRLGLAFGVGGEAHQPAANQREIGDRHGIGHQLVGEGGEPRGDAVQHLGAHAVRRQRDGRARPGRWRAAPELGWRGRLRRGAGPGCGGRAAGGRRGRQHYRLQHRDQLLAPGVVAQHVERPLGVGARDRGGGGGGGGAG